jgi:hypothetical protein
MYVRWRRRQHSERGRYRLGPKRRAMSDGSLRYPVVGFVSEPKDEWTLSAVLVESVRTPAGPRQKVICYLGSIVERREGHHGRRASFWATADPRLEEAGVAGEGRTRIVAALEARVPRPTAEGLAAEQAESDALTEALRSRAGRGKAERPFSLNSFCREWDSLRYLEAVAAEHPDSREARRYREWLAQQKDGEDGEGD